MAQNERKFSRDELRNIARSAGVQVDDEVTSRADGALPDLSGFLRLTRDFSQRGSWSAQHRRAERDAARVRRELAAEEEQKAVWEERQRAAHTVRVFDNHVEFLLSMHKDVGPEWDWHEVSIRVPPDPPLPTHTFAEQVRATASSLQPPPEPTHVHEQRFREKHAPPAPPRPLAVHEKRARAAAASYQPTFFQALFGTEGRRREEYQREIVEALHQDAVEFAAAEAAYAEETARYARRIEKAKQRDAEAFAVAQTEYEQRLDDFRRAEAEAEAKDHDAHLAAQREHAHIVAQIEWEQRVAAGVLRGNLAAFRAVLEHLAPFAELGESGMNVTVDVLREDVAVLRCVVANDEIMPREKHELSSSGKLVTKSIPAVRYWGVYQDYVCGCALRAAREVFALLPLPRVVVNVAVAGIDTTTGHDVYKTILAVSIPREVAEQLRYESLDPSDSLANFDHRMRFKKSAGFEAVEPISADEAFISAKPTRR